MFLYKAAFLLIPFSWFGLASGQAWVRSNVIPVQQGPVALASAWAGGLQAPQFSEIDLDNNGGLDLLVFDRLDDAVLPFINAATSNTVDYRFAPEFIANFPSDLFNWVLARDYDGDGLMDLFCGTAQGSNIRVYRNTSASTGGNLSFGLAKDKLLSRYASVLTLYSAANDLPSISDIDGDGDLDILVFHVGGSFVEWHRNTSVEDFGHSDSLHFMVQSNCFGHFQESQGGCDVVLGLTPCGQGQKPGQTAILEGKQLLHAGSTLLALDLDSDQISDLIVGDVSCTDLYGLHNAGSLQVADFDFYERGFPSQSSPMEILNFPATFFLDLDNDGLKDLVAAPNAKTNAEDQRGVQWQKNIGTNSSPTFVDQGHGLLQSEMIETGTASHAAFFDHNADGLLDLCIGTSGRYDSAGGNISRLYLYENVGTSTAAAFSLVDSDFLAFSQSPNVSANTFLSPAFGDIDGDQDVDLLIGKGDGFLLRYENLGGTGNPANFSLVSTHFGSIDVGLNSTPALLDLDSDQDLDLVVGNHQGKIACFRNDGSPQSPLMVLVDPDFGGIKVNDVSGQNFTNGYASPAFANVDQDPELEMLVGTITGEVQVYDSISLVPGTNFPRLADLAYLDFGSFSTPSAAFLDASGWSFVVGMYRGGLALLRQAGPLHASELAHTPLQGLGCFPNPASEEVCIRLEGIQGLGGLMVFNTTGALQYEGEFRGGKAMLDVRGWAKGLYYVQVRIGKRIASARLLVN